MVVPEVFCAVSVKPRLKFSPRWVKAEAGEQARPLRWVTEGLLSTNLAGMKRPTLPLAVPLTLPVLR